ncbi:unnamed protein product [Boreogadus saida]
MEDGHLKEFQKESDVGKGPKWIFKMTFRPVMRRLFLPRWIDGEPCGSPTSALFELKLGSSAEELKARLRGWGPEACGARVDRRLRLETRGLQHRTRGPCLVEELVEALPGIDQQGFLNVFLERRRAGRGAVNLEDDHHSTNKDWKPRLWLRRADGGAKTLVDDITLPTRILDPHQESGGLMEKLYIWKANPEDNQNSTIKDSSHTRAEPRLILFGRRQTHLS